MQLITDPGVISGYLTDASNTTGHAEALVRPRTTEEVAAVVARCQRENIPLTITAQRTSTTGAPVPQGGWLLSTERLDRILSIDPEGGVAEAEAGSSPLGSSGRTKGVSNGQSADGGALAQESARTARTSRGMDRRSLAWLRGAS